VGISGSTFEYIKSGEIERAIRKIANDRLELNEKYARIINENLKNTETLKFQPELIEPIEYIKKFNERFSNLLKDNGVLKSIPESDLKLKWNTKFPKGFSEKLENIEIFKSKSQSEQFVEHTGIFNDFLKNMETFKPILVQSPEKKVTIKVPEYFKVSYTSNYEIGVHSIYSGVDWIYTHVETLYIFDYKIVYFWLLNSVYDESIDFFFTSVWYASLQTSGLQLFWSVILDKYVLSSLSQFSLTDE
jgi:hypothetical protein